MAEPILKCSFCGKQQGDVAKLIAGPAVYICNECVDICNEILDDQNIPRVSADQLAKDYATRATTDLKAAGALMELGHYRVAIDVLRGGIGSALRALLFNRDGQCYIEDFPTLMRHAFSEDEGLRRLGNLRITDLIAKLEFNAAASEADAQSAFKSATKIIDYVLGIVEPA